MIIPLIMAGGIGSRFWPLSRKDKPKQFLHLVDKERSMIQITVDRIAELTQKENIFIATSDNYVKKINEQLPEITQENITVEPMRRNTAACIGLSSIYIEKKYNDAVMVVLPSDHLILDNNIFIENIRAGVEVAKEGNNLVTVGIKPDKPETGYGYINYGEKVKEVSDYDIYKVKAFTEKPNLEKAKDFMNKGTYLWNSGMFIWKVSTIRNMFKKYMPDLHRSLEKIKKAINTPKEKEVLLEQFKNLDSISIDYGVLEKCENLYVIPGSFGWDDIGNWSALERIENKDDDGNYVEGNHIGIDTKNAIIHGGSKIITTVGLDDIVIVDTDDAILICDKKRAQEVKEIRELLNSKGLKNYL